MHTNTHRTAATAMATVANGPTSTRAISGVGGATAEALADHGIETVSDVIAAGASGLTEINGFRHARASEVVAAATEIDGGEPADAEESDTASGRGAEREIEDEDAMIADSAAGGSVSIGRFRSNGDSEGGDD
jgi:threonine dehydratase